MKNTLIIIGVVAVAGIGAYIWYQSTSVTEVIPDEGPEQIINEEVVTEPVVEESDNDQATEVEPTATPSRPGEEVIGRSAGGRDIKAYNFGTGPDTVLFVGGIHGGYAFNTSLLAYELIDYLESNPTLIPETITVSVVPILNPDGIERATGNSGRFTAAAVTTNDNVRVASRFNANEVDLNRNFDCQWQREGTWQDRTVSGGNAAFSEPEAQAIQGFVQTHRPVAVVAWYAAAGEVFASACGSDAVLPQTTALSELYATASGYTAQPTFEYYTITGDMMDWLARNQIPAISVLLSDRENTEWSRNRPAIEALLNELGS